MKAEHDPPITAFSMLFGAVLFAICIVISCSHAHHKRIKVPAVDVSAPASP